MPKVTAYQVTIGSRVVRISLRRVRGATLARIDDGPELSVGLATVHGVLRSLEYGDAHCEAMAARLDDGTIGVAIGGVEYRAEVVDEAHARLASVVCSATA